jgi:ketosteroid isomerase-like protein
MSTSNTSSFTADLFADIDSQDAHAFASRISEDGRFRIGSAEPVIGRAAIEAGLTGFFGMIKSLSHETLDQWDVGDVTIIESAVTYIRLDDGQVTVPAVSILRRGDELIDDYRIFIDLGPVLS